MVEITSGPTRIGAIPILVQPISTDTVIYTGGGQICGWSLRDVSASQPNQASGSVVAPGAGATIVQLTGLAAGTYRITWTVELQGAAAAADANNFQLFSNAGNILVSVNQGAAGVYAQINAEVTVAANATIGIKAIGAGTAGVTYSADLEISIQGEPQTTIEIQDTQNIFGELAFTTFRSNTEWFGIPGIEIMGRVLIHVISGTVTGTVYVYPDSSSQ